MNGLKPIGEQGSQTVFLGIKHGRITRKNIETSEEELYQSVSGRLAAVTQREADINGSVVTFLDLHLQNGDERYKLSVNMESGAARSIINSLASASSFDAPLLIRPWEGDPDESGRRFTNVSVYQGEESKERRLPWAVELPKVKYTVVGRNTVPDDTERYEAVQALIGRVRTMLGQSAESGSGDAAESPGDLPAGW